MNSNAVRKSLTRQRQRLAVTIALLSLSVVALCLLALMVGTKFYSPQTVIQVLSGKTIKGASFAVGTLRLPRMLAGLLAGVAFGIAGSTFQTILRNPLASPDIIGVTAGSSTAAVFCLLVLGQSRSMASFAAVLFGLLISMLIYFLSKGGHFSGGRLILIGIGIQAMLNSVIHYMLLKASQYDVPSAMRWLSGSLNTIQMSQLPLLVVAVVLFGTVIAGLSRVLSILELGEHSAISLGVRTDLVRLLLIGSAVCLLAFATAVTGPISFVAFLSGPIAKRLVGSGLPHLIPAGLVGAVLVLTADFIGQFALGLKLPAGVITGILGAPYLLTLLIRMNRSGGTA